MGVEYFSLRTVKNGLPRQQPRRRRTIGRPITYEPLDPERQLQVGQLCYSPESLAEWILEQKELEDLYHNRLTEDELLALLHLLDGREGPYYPEYNTLVHLVGRRLGITFAYLIYRTGAELPETMTHYRTLRAAHEQAEREMLMDGKERELEVHAVTDEMRFVAPL